MVCKNCNEFFPSSYEKCPHCGAENTASKVKKVSLKRRQRIFAVLALLVFVGLIVVFSTLIVNMMKPVQKPDFSNMYFVKDRQIYSLSQDMAPTQISAELYRKGTEPSGYVDTSSRSLITYGKDSIFFYEDYNFTSQSGNYYIKKSNADKILISDNVALPKVFPGTNNILFLKNYNPARSIGELYLMKDGGVPVKIADDVNDRSFKFGYDTDTIMFTQNYDSTTKKGDLYFMKTGQDKVLVDSAVYTPLAISTDAKFALYTKNYKTYKDGNTERPIYDMYLCDISSGKKIVGYNVDKYAIINKDTLRFLFLGNFSQTKKLGDLYSADIANDKTRIDIEVSKFIPPSIPSSFTGTFNPVLYCKTNAKATLLNVYYTFNDNGTYTDISPIATGIPSSFLDNYSMTDKNIFGFSYPEGSTSGPADLFSIGISGNALDNKVVIDQNASYISYPQNINTDPFLYLKNYSSPSNSGELLFYDPSTNSKTSVDTTTYASLLNSQLTTPSFSTGGKGIIFLNNYDTATKTADLNLRAYNSDSNISVAKGINADPTLGYAISSDLKSYIYTKMPQGAQATAGITSLDLYAKSNDNQATSVTSGISYIIRP